MFHNTTPDLQDQDQDRFLVSVRSCPKTDGLRPHHSLVTAPTEMRSEKKEETRALKMELQLCHVRRFSGNLIGIVVIEEEDGMGRGDKKRTR